MSKHLRSARYKWDISFFLSSDSQVSESVILVNGFSVRQPREGSLSTSQQQWVSLGETGYRSLCSWPCHFDPPAETSLALPVTGHWNPQDFPWSPRTWLTLQNTQNLPVPLFWDFHWRQCQCLRPQWSLVFSSSMYFLECLFKYSSNIPKSLFTFYDTL